MLQLKRSKILPRGLLELCEFQTILDLYTAVLPFVSGHSSNWIRKALYSVRIFFTCLHFFLNPSNSQHLVQVTLIFSEIQVFCKSLNSKSFATFATFSKLLTFRLIFLYSQFQQLFLFSSHRNYSLIIKVNGSS